MVECQPVSYDSGGNDMARVTWSAADSAKGLCYDDRRETTSGNDHRRPTRRTTRQDPAAYTITVTGEALDDLRLDVTWDPDLGRHTIHELTITEHADGDYVRVSEAVTFQADVRCRRVPI